MICYPCHQKGNKAGEGDEAFGTEACPWPQVSWMVWLAVVVVVCNFLLANLSLNFTLMLLLQM